MHSFEKQRSRSSSNSGLCQTRLHHSLPLTQALASSRGFVPGACSQAARSRCCAARGNGLLCLSLPCSAREREERVALSLERLPGANDWIDSNGSNCNAGQVGDAAAVCIACEAAIDCQGVLKQSADLLQRHTEVVSSTSPAFVACVRAVDAHKIKHVQRCWSDTALSQRNIVDI